MPEPTVVIVGAGGFGREVLDVLRSIDPYGARWRFAGFVADDEPDAGLLDRIHASFLGNDETFLRHPTATHYTVAIGDPCLRRLLVERYDAAGLKPISLIHPTASIGSDVLIGEGAVVCAHVSITTNIRIGRHVHIDRMATIGHDSVIDDFVTLHPGSVISGAVHIGSGTRVGTNASILPEVLISHDVVIGAGAVLTKDAECGQTYAGVPARPISSGRG
jgi:sugar O-acyltransferase (sialic acid O-acetyltransferase NeuD family)